MKVQNWKSEEFHFGTKNWMSIMTQKIPFSNVEGEPLCAEVCSCV